MSERWELLQPLLLTTGSKRQTQVHTYEEEVRAFGLLVIRLLLWEGKYRSHEENKRGWDLLAPRAPRVSQSLPGSSVVMLVTQHALSYPEI